MFQTGLENTTDSMNQKPPEYLIAETDFIEMRIFTNDGFKLVDITQNTSTSSGQPESIQYLVEPGGGVKFPLIGKVNLKGKTIREAEKILEDHFAVYYNTPFVKLRVTNRHVLVFTGEGGIGKVVYLQNENTTIVEALTLAGGIYPRGKAFKIKIIRGDLKNPEVFFVDLSTMDGLKKSVLTVQSNDIIYVEPSSDYASKLLAQLAPIVGIIASVLLIVDIINK